MFNLKERRLKKNYEAVKRNWHVLKYAWKLSKNNPEIVMETER